jgi:hypothetical protein
MMRSFRHDTHHRLWSPSEFGTHCFYVEISASPREAVRIFEDYGFDGDESRRETTECRSILARELWTKIRDDARRDFDEIIFMDIFDFVEN